MVLIDVSLAPSFVGFLGVYFDLLSTRVALELGCVESHPLGNIPPLEYGVFISVPLALQIIFSKLGVKPEHGRVLALIYALTPFVALLQNLYVLGT